MLNLCSRGVSSAEQVDFSIGANTGYEAETDHDLILKPLSSMFLVKTEKEIRIWQNMNSLRLPSYQRLCILEFHHIKKGVMNSSLGGSWAWALVALPVFLLVISGVSHLLTPIGRCAIWSVLTKCFIFIRLTQGYWTDEDVEIFKIHKKVFEYSSVWSHPEVLLRIHDYVLQDTFDELRRSEAPNLKYDEIVKLFPAIKMFDLHEQMRADYGSVMYGTIGMRATLLQAMPYMTFLSIFTISTCANPIFVFSRNLHDRMHSSWFQDPWIQARRLVQERIEMEGGVRKEEVHERTHALPNPDYDSDGIQVPQYKRQLIDAQNAVRIERIASGRLHRKEVESSCIRSESPLGSAETIKWL